MGYPIGVPHCYTYWCACEEIQIRTNYCKKIKSRYSLLKWEEIAKMYQKTTNIGLYKEEGPMKSLLSIHLSLLWSVSSIFFLGALDMIVSFLIFSYFFKLYIV